MYDTTRVAFLATFLRVKLPSMSVATAFLVPSTVTVAPIMGSSVPSTTVPDTVMFCALALKPTQSTNRRSMVFQCVAKENCRSRRLRPWIKSFMFWC